MEPDFPSPIDDSVEPIHREREIMYEEEQREEPRYYYTHPPQMQTPPPMPLPQMQAPQPQKKIDIFSELDRIHWIIFISVVLLAFFIGKSISTPVIIRSS